MIAKKTVGAGLGLVALAASAVAQNYPPPPPSGPYPQSAPPSGQYAPPPPGYEQNGDVYDEAAQRYDDDYGRRYAAWAATYCVRRQHDDTARDAVIGGAAGAVLGGLLSGRHHRAQGVIVGGAVGAGTGALIGSSHQAPGGCPPGYVLRGGAPSFAYGAPAGAVFWAPRWYNPWIWYGGHWVYRPYRDWYFTHGGPYWAPGWRPGPYRYHGWPH